MIAKFYLNIGEKTVRNQGDVVAPGSQKGCGFAPNPVFKLFELWLMFGLMWGPPVKFQSKL